MAAAAAASSLRLGVILPRQQVRLMTEILTAIKFIKLCAWENSFAHAVAGVYGAIAASKTAVIVVICDSPSTTVKLRIPTCHSRHRYIIVLAAVPPVGHENCHYIFNFIHQHW